MPLTLTQMLALLPDNTAGDITAEDMRDVVEALYDWVPPQQRYLRGRQADETAHTDDVFFDSGAAAAPSFGTAQTPSGTAAWLEGRGVLSARFFNQSADDIAVYLKAITSASAPMTFETRATLLYGYIDFPAVGLAISNGTAATSNVYVFYFNSSNTSFTNGTNLAAYSGVINAVVDLEANLLDQLGLIVPPTLYLRVIWKSANTFKVGYSLDGVSWIYSGDTSDTLTPTHFGPAVSTFGGGDTAGDLVMGTFDYLRVYDADLSA